MKDISFKDFDILSPSEKEEAITLLSRYEQIDKQENCKKTFYLLLNICGESLLLKADTTK